MNYFDPKNPIDCAWRSRVPAFMRAPSAGDNDAHVDAWRARPSAIVKASTIAAEYVARPFDFADLAGKPEPSSWGPVYPKTASATVDKWRMTARGRDLSEAEKAEYGQAVGEWIKGLNSVKPAPRVSLKYSMPNYAAKCRAEFAAAAGVAKRQWADGKLKNDRGETIGQAYARAMDEKAARLAGEPVREPKRQTVAEAWQGPVKLARRPRKLARMWKAA